MSAIANTSASGSTTSRSDSNVANRSTVQVSSKGGTASRPDVSVASSSLTAGANSDSDDELSTSDISVHRQSLASGLWSPGEEENSQVYTA